MRVNDPIPLCNRDFMQIEGMRLGSRVVVGVIDTAIFADGNFYESLHVVFFRDVVVDEDRVATRSMNKVDCFFATICVDVRDNNGASPFASEGLC